MSWNVKKKFPPWVVTLRQGADSSFSIVSNCNFQHGFLLLFEISNVIWHQWLGQRFLCNSQVTGQLKKVWSPPAPGRSLSSQSSTSRQTLAPAKVDNHSVCQHFQRAKVIISSQQKWKVIFLWWGCSWYLRWFDSQMNVGCQGHWIINYNAQFFIKDFTLIDVYFNFLLARKHLLVLN